MAREGQCGDPKERVSLGVPVITTEHENIHEGHAFSVACKYANVADAASVYLELNTPAAGYVHFKGIAFQSDGPKVTIELIEAPTRTTGSTALTPVNRRRVGTPVAATVTVKSDPTSVSAGTVIDTDYLGGGTGAGASNHSGSATGNAEEFVLKPSTVYLVKATNNGGGAATINLKAFWYEEVSA